MAYSNASVAQMQRDALTSFEALRAEVRALRVEVARLTGTPVSAPAIVAAASPIVATDPKTPKAAALHCAGYGQAGTPKACQREFGKAENLAMHNAWAHKA